MKHGKKYVDGAKLIERSRLYDTQEALDLCVKTGTAKFDETVEVHVKLGVDGRHADQQVRGAIAAARYGQDRPRARNLQAGEGRRGSCSRC